MEVGTGIFLGLVFVGMVTLYIVTKDRWNWRRLTIRGALGVVALIGLLLFGTWGINLYENRIVPQTEFMGVKLADTQADVRFKKGKPHDDKDTEIAMYSDSSGEFETVIIYRDGKIRKVQYVGKCGGCYNIHGLGVGTTYEDVLEKLGQPSYLSASADNEMRIASFEKLNLMFQFAEGKVIGYGIYNVAFGPVKFSTKPAAK